MKFVVNWKPREGGSAAENEADTKRALQVFGKWSPPQGLNILQFLSRVDGEGGYVLVETDDPALLAEGPAKFGVFNEFSIVPVMDITDSIAIAQEGVEFRDSIS